MKIRAIQKIEIGGHIYLPGEIVEGLSKAEIEKGIEDGYLAEKKSPKKVKRDKNS